MALVSWRKKKHFFSRLSVPEMRFLFCNSDDSISPSKSQLYKNFATIGCHLRVIFMQGADWWWKWFRKGRRQEQGIIWSSGSRRRRRWWLSGCWWWGRARRRRRAGDGAGGASRAGRCTWRSIRGGACPWTTTRRHGDASAGITSSCPDSLSALVLLLWNPLTSIDPYVRNYVRILMFVRKIFPISLGFRWCKLLGNLERWWYFTVPYFLFHFFVFPKGQDRWKSCHYFIYF